MPSSKRDRLRAIEAPQRFHGVEIGHPGLPIGVPGSGEGAVDNRTNARGRGEDAWRRWRPMATSSLEIERPFKVIFHGQVPPDSEPAALTICGEALRRRRRRTRGHNIEPRRDTPTS